MIGAGGNNRQNNRSINDIAPVMMEASTYSLLIVVIGCLFVCLFDTQFL